jgi:two-component system OmpR family sensor kinase
LRWKAFNWRLPVRRELILSHGLVALLLIAITAGFSYGAFRSYLIASQESQLVHSGTQVSRIMQGYFTGEIDAPTADYLLSGLENALQAHVYVVDPVGQVILSSGQSNIPVAPIPLAAMKQVLWQGRTWTGTLPAGAGTLLVVGVPIELPGQIAGGIWLEEPLAPALARAGGLLLRMLWGGGIGILAALTVALWLSDRLARPLSALNRAAGQVAAGRFTERVAEEGPAEVRELAARFNQMAGSLAGMVQDLRHEAEFRDELLAHVAHDLKTPLTTIRGYLEAVQDGLLKGSEASSALHVAHAETLRLQRLVARLLDAARLEASLADAHDRIPVKSWLDDVAARLLPLAQEKDVHLTTAAPPELILVTHADAASEVLVNLLANAIQWSPRGGRVEICGEAEAEGVRIAVSDEGPGVDPALVNRVFRPFVTGDAARTEKGTGLGLAIAERLVTAMGGRLGIRNRPEGGLQAWFWLPVTARA